MLNIFFIIQVKLLFVGNTILLLTFLLEMKKENVTNMFIINLAVSDTLVLFISAPFKVIEC